MADERTVEWWEGQVANYKRELDELNPQLDAARARVKQLEADAIESSRLSEELDQWRRAYKYEVGAKQSLAQQNTELIEGNANLREDIQALKAGNQRKLDHLQRCLKAASDFVAVLNEGIAGEL